MKLEFLESGSPDCPLIRLYEFNTREAYNLRRIAVQPARSKEQMIRLHEEKGVFSIAGRQLIVRQGQKDREVAQIAPLKFLWVLSKTGWLQVASLIRPFSRGSGKGWQWLSEKGQARILLSCDGSW